MRIDAAAYLGAWPFRAVEGGLRGLEAMLEEEGLTGALVSPLAGLFHTDPALANDRLLRSLRGRRSLWAVPASNARLADCHLEIERLSHRRQVRGVRLAPAFHGYPAAEAADALRTAARCGLAAVIQLRVQDARGQPPGLHVSDLPLGDALALAEAVPEARVVIAGAKLAELGELSRLQARPDLWLDISHLDGLDCLARACDAIGDERLLFATCWPFFYARAARLKVEEAELSPQARARLLGGNAVRAFGLPVEVVD